MTRHSYARHDESKRKAIAFNAAVATLDTGQHASCLFALDGLEIISARISKYSRCNVTAERTTF